MKTTRFFLIAATMVAGLAAMASCENNIEPEKQEVVEGPVLLMAEGFNSSTATKTSVQGSTVQWEDGDVVNLNGTDYSITVSGDQASVNASSLVGQTVYGYYGCTATDGQTTTPTVTIPASYAFSLNSDGDQVISLPMAAYSDPASNTIVFKHLSAAVNITIWNATGSTLYIDAVTVTANTYRLNGACTLDLTAANFGITPNNTNVSEADRSVTITFATPLQIAKGQENAKSIQVPIMPIGADNLTINVASHNADISGVPVSGFPVSGLTHVFNHSATTAELGRNVMVSAKVKISPISATVTSKGTFSISDTEAIYFSKGNLQATTADGGTSWTWAFAPTQYNFIGAVDDASSSNPNPTANTFVTNAEPWFDNTKNGTVDLFGWVQKNAPFASSTASGAQYGIAGSTNRNDYEGNSSSDGLAHDWGEKIDEGWFTLSKAQWFYLLYTRGEEGKAPTTHYQVEPNGSDTPARWFKAKVANVAGLVLIPDDFTWPATVEMKTGFITMEGYSRPVLNNQNASYRYNIDANEWTALENAGCVFLPAAGYRDGSEVKQVPGAQTQYSNAPWGSYWSTTMSDGWMVNTLDFSGESLTLTYGAFTYPRFGLSVRLAYPAN